LGIIEGENKLYKAYHLLKDNISLGNRYKFALVCMKMQKYEEAEKALKLSDDLQVIGGAPGCYLLGMTLERLARQRDAIKYYSRAIELDPTLWVAFERLCKLEPKANYDAIFKEDHPVMVAFNGSIGSKDYFNKTGSPLNNLIQNNTQGKFQISYLVVLINNKQEVPHDTIGNENRGGLKSMDNSNLGDTKKFLRVAVPNALPAVSGPSAGKRTSIKIPQKIKNFNVVPGKNTEELKTETPFTLAINTTTQFNQKSTDESPPLRHSFKARHTAKIEPTMLSLLKQIAGTVQYLAAYKCSEAIKLIKQLPKNQYNTGWTLTQLGRALFESLRYTEAEKAYREALNVDPCRLEGVEYYSTCLWHLKKHVDLCTLSNQVLKISLFSAEAWCAVGNFFSLQKEHETALKYFKRAIQLNPHCAYAYTLSGHEYAANEDFDNARKCYQKAISCDERHYNAFWGMGNICLRQEKYDQAIQYFRNAIRINYKSSVLHTYLGMTYFHNKQGNEALDCFEKAEKLDPENPLNKYQKATVLISTNKFTEALNVLEELRIKVPKEAPIHVLIGKIHKKMGNKDKALAHFNMAMDLDPKESNVIKSLIDRLERDTDLPEENEI